MSRIAVREERCEMFVTGLAEGSVAWQRAKQDRRKGVQHEETRSRQPECVSVRSKRVRCECELLDARCLLRVGDHGGSKGSSRRRRVGRRKVRVTVS